jgi:hypothetical protein
MLLSVHSRLVLLGLASKAEGNLATLRLVRDFQQALGFSEDELAALKIETTDTGMRWQNAVEPKEIAVGPALKKAVAKWFDPEKLTLETFPIYEQFAGE